MKKIYQRFCRAIEDGCFYKQSTNTKLFIWLVVSFGGAWILLQIAKEIEKKHPYTIWPVLIALYSIFFIFWFGWRALMAAGREDEEEYIKREIDRAPLNWERFELKAKDDLPILDFNVFDRDSIYSKLSSWQQAVGDKNFLIERLEPFGWKFQEFQTQRDFINMRFPKYEFYFQQNSVYLHITTEQKRYSVSLERLLKVNEITQIGEYSDLENNNGIDIWEIEKILEGDKYGQTDN